ncbi:hypothetical protein OG292_03355 [Streptomyces sp. NBC_01511]|uniref:hypothetical protein n=1 Tax=Streptomyces sp. NBC_01511 TaxID=2903889 RepID=UPI00386E1507
MTRVEWQWRERGSGGAPYQQRVSVPEILPPLKSNAELLSLIEHETRCTACNLRTDGAFCPAAAALVRAEKEARR